MELLINITKIINNWDPIGLFPFSPKDEYVTEVNEIYSFIVNNKHDVNETELANQIHLIFVKQFTESVFTLKISDCVLISKQILETLKR